MESKLNPTKPSDYFASRCDVFVHPTAMECDENGKTELELKTGMEIIVNAGQPAKLARK